MDTVLTLAKSKKIFKPFLASITTEVNSSSLNLLGAFSIREGLLFVYSTQEPFSLNAVLFDKQNAEKLLWKTSSPIWQIPEKIEPLKIIANKRALVFHFRLKEKLQIAEFSLDHILLFQKKPPSTLLKKPAQNPILHPKTHHSWESSAVFNAGALYLENKVHFIYRAIGESGLSVFGYAASKDGIHIDTRLDKPAFVLNDTTYTAETKNRALSSPYLSGGSWAGCEDPRLTQIHDTIYMTYTTFNGWQPPAVALTSIAINDFVKQRWNWQPPVVLSSPHGTHKNWVIFPEKINGHYAILHSLSPKIQIDYFDDLQFNNTPNINSYYHSTGRDYHWDNWMRGAGPPPIKTKLGWLLIYHAMDKKDPNKYKIGAMILDSHDPTQILYRSHYPLLEPDAFYENNGCKAGVIYSCGAVVIDKKLFIYYGGADTVICVAVANLDHLLAELHTSLP